jgi:leucyl-tRNA synthetase
VLANEEVIDGKSEIGSHPVERRPLRQWMLRITAYAQRLIDELDGLDWPDSIKQHQRNWIGRSEGAEVHFKMAESGDTVTVFTTRPDTLYGATYMVLAPEHRLVDLITTEEQWPSVREYREKAARKSDLERTELSKEKDRCLDRRIRDQSSERRENPHLDRGLRAAWLRHGAIMAVPGHDERDWEFARTFGLPIREVVSQSPTLGLGGGSVCEAEPLDCFVGEGYAIHSGPLDGLPTADAKREIVRRLEEGGLGRRTGEFQAARLALQPPALLGRTVPARVGRRKTSRPGRKRVAGYAAGDGRFQTDWNTRAAAEQGEGLAEVFGNRDARDQHDAAMGRQLLVLSALHRRAKS